MNRFRLIILSLILASTNLTGQSVKVSCTEKWIKSKGEEFPYILRICRIKNFKFIETTYPDGVGRYFDSEHELYILINKKYIKTVNSKLFNKKQDELVSLINE